MAKMEKQDESGRKLLPARSSRGTRIHKLIGEEAEADETFWSQGAWQEDEEDADYSTEEEEEDVVDSDFDEEEEPDNDVHDEEQEDGDKKTRRRAARNDQKRTVYKEPKSVTRSFKRPWMTIQPDAQPMTDIEISGVTEQQSTKARTPSMTYEGPTVRRSTARKSSESSELRKRITEEAARLSAKQKKQSPASKATTRLTQAQLLAEAVRTELENSQSLNRLEQLEEEKKAETVTPKAPFTGQMVRYHSRIGMPKTITFLNTTEYPSIFNQSKPKKPNVANRTRYFGINEEHADEDDEVEDNDSAEETKHGEIIDIKTEHRGHLAAITTASYFE